MKIPFLNIWVTRCDWKFLYEHEVGVLKNERKVMNDYLYRQRETYVCKDGRLRYKHNGQFAPDNRLKTKRLHDQLKAEVAYKQAQAIVSNGSSCIGHYDDVRKASKI